MENRTAHSSAFSTVEYSLVPGEQFFLPDRREDQLPPQAVQGPLCLHWDLITDMGTSQTHVYTGIGPTIL